MNHDLNLLLVTSVYAFAWYGLSLVTPVAQAILFGFLAANMHVNRGLIVDHNRSHEKKCSKKTCCDK